MAAELNNSDNYSIEVTEINLRTSSSFHNPTFLYKEEFINTRIIVSANDNNPKKVWTVIYNSNYHTYGFWFEGCASRNVGNYADTITWGIGYNENTNTWFNDGLDTNSGPNYAITNPGAGDNYAELVSGTPDKFDFYMDLRSFGSTQTMLVVGSLQIFANPIVSD